MFSGCLCMRACVHLCPSRGILWPVCASTCSHVGLIFVRFTKTIANKII